MFLLKRSIVITISILTILCISAIHGMELETDGKNAVEALQKKESVEDVEKQLAEDSDSQLSMYDVEAPEELKYQRQSFETAWKQDEIDNQAQRCCCWFIGGVFCFSTVPFILAVIRHMV